MGKNTVEAKTCLDKHYGVSAPGKSTIFDWYSNFKRGRTSTEDSKRSGRPKEVIIPEIIRQVRQIVLTDRRVKVREIAETVGISTGSAVSILHDHLHMKKLNVKWVPHFLDIEQREKRVADSKSCLDMLNRNPSEFLRRYITMDETWIHHYTPESNRSSAEWREAGESRSKRVKASRWAGKSTIFDWYSNFKRGRTSTEISKRSGRPKEVIIPEIIRQVRQIVLTDRRVKVREIAETVGISTGSAVSILHDHLHMKKLNVKWVPHFLDIEQRKKRVADSKSCLDMLNRNPSEFLRRYITMDETWIHHYIPESNRSSAEWREAGESRSKRVKASRWAGRAKIFLCYLPSLALSSAELFHHVGCRIVKCRPESSVFKHLLHQVPRYKGTTSRPP
ncbi:hypothetical protein ACLKA7_001317 [Drosophila subpalustris]